MLDPYFSATEDRVAAAATSTGWPSARGDGRALFGTVDSWLIWNLTGEHVTDTSNASRTMLCDLRTGAWAPELCELFGVPERALPQIRPSIGAFGTVREDALPGHGGVPVAGVAGDQQAALYGQACLDPGQGKNTYGTGSFVLVNTGERPAAARRRACWPPSRGRSGSAPCTRWRRRSSSPAPPCSGCATASAIVKDAAETQALAASLSSNDGVYFVPALTGLGSPHWDPYARGTIVGLTRGTGARAPRPRGARGDGLPDRRRRPRDGGRLRPPAARA